ncbi:non-ribosomal peptide synthetase, partial [Paenibacillus radicis (ex Gao et al. 2016)]|uniref:non-ribosomal peptide synthetase n=1 Tax=Paenibacillus radicis (ex Gao et al. 2016) TaxID=1737354 RepID=UPI001668E962
MTNTKGSFSNGNNVLKRTKDIVVAATFTAEPLLDHLRWWSRQFDIELRVQFAPYHQVFQQLVNSDSLFAANIDGLNIALIRFEDWIREEQSEDDEDLSLKLLGYYYELTQAIKESDFSSPLFIGILPPSSNSRFSSMVMKQLNNLNQKLLLTFKDTPNVYVKDFYAIESIYQIEKPYNEIGDKIGHIPYSDEYYAALGTMLARNIRAYMMRRFKVFALDCDNTLWKGICGEDGYDGVEITENHQLFQKLLLGKIEEGFLLALCSKNNESDVWDVFDHNAAMVLKREHIVAHRINWESKSANLRKIASDLNVSSDSIIFIDDSLTECMEVMTNCPEALALKLPGDEQAFVPFMNHVWALDIHKVTQEDQERSAMYTAENRRKEASVNDTYHQYLERLQIKMSIRRIQPAELTRAAQLTSRTSQFVLSSIPRDERELMQLAQDPDYRIWTIRVSDKFGNYGLCGLVIARVLSDSLRIDTFLLSCRVLGRKIEEAVLVCVKHFCEEEDRTLLECTYKDNGRNAPFLTFLQNSGWQCASGESGTLHGRLETGSIADEIPYVDVVEDLGAECVAAKDSLVITQAQSIEPYSQNFQSDDWSFTLVNEDQLIHKAYLTPLNYPTAEKLLQIPFGVFVHSPSDLQEVEDKLRSLWRRYLKRDDIADSDSFFNLGGNSLTAALFVSRISEQFEVELSLPEFFRKPTILEVAALIRGADSIVYQRIEPIAQQTEYEVSSAQKRMYVLQQAVGASTHYNMPQHIVITGPLVRSRLAAALQSLVSRHESLRTSFAMKDGKPVQRIHASVPFELAYEEKDETEISAQIISDFVHPFDLGQAPLFRAKLIHLAGKIGGEQYSLLLDMHHSISDGVSMNWFIADLWRLYRGDTLPELTLQYKDYAAWQQRQVQSEALQKQRQYWLDMLGGELPTLDFPADFARPSVQQFGGSEIIFQTDQAVAEKLRRLASESASTLYMVLLASYQVLLAKYTGQEDIMVGTPVAGRSHADTHEMTGVFVNTLVMRGSPKGGKIFRQYLAEVREQSLLAFEHQDYPFEALVEQLHVKRDLSRNPLFDTMFILQNAEASEYSVEGLAIRAEAVESHVSKFDFSMEAWERQDTIAWRLEYSTALFERGSMERLSQHFLHLLEVIAANPDTELQQLNGLSAAERKQIVEAFNATAADFPREQTIHGLFEAQAARIPEQTAVSLGSESLTYGELNAKANRLARTLRDAGIGADSLVGLMAERSLDMIVAVMAILKAGGAYVPFDPAHPEARIRYMLEDSGAKLLLTQTHLKEHVSFYKGQVIVLEDEAAYGSDGSDLEAASGPEHLAYVIYTSGTTGQPKGVMIEHHSVVNRLHWMQKAYPLTDGDVLLQKTPVTFDVSVWELFWWAIAGQQLRLLPPQGEKDPRMIVETIAQGQVTVIHFVPSMFQMFLLEMERSGNRGLSQAASLKTIFVSGEALPLPQAEAFFRLFGERVQLVNLYGPTEATVDVSHLRCEPGMTRMTIGKPIDNNRLLIVNTNGQLQPIGVTGELCIAGEGLARGYLNRAELTAEKFASSPLTGGERMYRTGDLAKWLPDGNVEYAGRIDHQVKIRGYRIELGEIESQLMKHDDVQQAIVLDKTDDSGQRYLSAYIAASREISVSEWRAYLSASLPEYMIPAQFIQVNAIPLTPNGKADRKALLQLVGEPSIGAPYEPPGNTIEAALAELWQEVLAVDRVGVYDRFLEAGGHSLKAIMMIARIEKAFGIELPLRQFFIMPTIREIAAYIQGADMIVFQPIEPIAKQTEYEVSSAQKRMYVLHQLEGANIHYNMPQHIVVTGSLDRSRLATALQSLVSRHESLRTSFAIKDGKPFQRIHASVSFELEYEETDTAEISAQIVSDFVQPFDLGEAPLFRAKLVQLAGGIDGQQYSLLLDMHHSISDGVSMNLYIADLWKLYRSDTLPELALQYKDYAAWQQRQLQSEALQKQREYWLDSLGGELPTLDFPADFARPSVQQFDGSELTFQTGQAVAENLRRLASESESSLYMVLLAIYQVLLAKYTGQEDIMVGTPVAGRSHADTHEMTGVFVNTLVMRGAPKGKKTFRQYLTEVKEQSLLAFEHQDYPFEALVEQLNMQRDLSRNPLFDTMFILQNADASEYSVEGLAIRAEAVESLVSKFDFSMEAWDRQDTIAWRLEYSTALFERRSMERLSQHFLRLMEVIAANPDAELQQLDWLSAAERKQIVEAFNATAADFPREQTIHGLFEAQAARIPEQTAVSLGSEYLTYGELNAKANRLARTLRDTGVGADSLVGLMADRSLNMIVAVMAILKAGGAYVPFDPAHPEARIRYMLEDSGAKLLLTQAHLKERVSFFTGQM